MTESKNKPQGAPERISELEMAINSALCDIDCLGGLMPSTVSQLRRSVGVRELKQNKIGASVIKGPFIEVCTGIFTNL